MRIPKMIRNNHTIIRHHHCCRSNIFHRALPMAYWYVVFYIIHCVMRANTQCRNIGIQFSPASSSAKRAHSLTLSVFSLFSLFFSFSFSCVLWFHNMDSFGAFVDNTFTPSTRSLSLSFTRVRAIETLSFSNQCANVQRSLFRITSPR
jgi:hypothetical protein